MKKKGKKKEEEEEEKKKKKSLLRRKVRSFIRLSLTSSCLRKGTSGPKSQKVVKVYQGRRDSEGTAE